MLKKQLIIDAPSTQTGILTSVGVLVDDFIPQPYQGDTHYYYNRLEGDRGVLNDSQVIWDRGQVTATIAPGMTWGGIWLSLNHPIRENLPVNFSALLPSPVQAPYQSHITDVTVQIRGGTPGREFRLELKNGPTFAFTRSIILNGGQQTMDYDLPPLGDITQLVFVLDYANPGNYVVIDQVAFTATTEVTDTATTAFVWSYAMLLNNWNPSTGLVRDKAKDASGEFDAIQATGALAAARVTAEQPPTAAGD